jgi:hypothetical protein
VRPHFYLVHAAVRWSKSQAFEVLHSVKPGTGS